MVGCSIGSMCSDSIVGWPMNRLNRHMTWRLSQKIRKVVFIGLSSVRMRQFYKKLLWSLCPTGGGSSIQCTRGAFLAWDHWSERRRDVMSATRAAPALSGRMCSFASNTPRSDRSVCLSVDKEDPTRLLVVRGRAAAAQLAARVKSRCCQVICYVKFVRTHSDFRGQSGDRYRPPRMARRQKLCTLADWRRRRGRGFLVFARRRRQLAWPTKAVRRSSLQHKLSRSTTKDHRRAASDRRLELWSAASGHRAALQNPGLHQPKPRLYTKRCDEQLSRWKISRELAAHESSKSECPRVHDDQCVGESFRARWS